ncbi:MAG: transcription elongation factor GreA [Patescibacteria group bacterium]
MIRDDSEYISQEGLKKLEEELKVLSDTSRKEIAARLEYAKSLGDLSENSEYAEAKEAQTANEIRIAEVKDLIQRAVIISKNHATDKVNIGVKVVAKKIDAGSTHEFFIVGPEEAKPEINKISHESPIGKALLGKKRGEEAKVFTPKGAVCYQILDIL